MNSPTDLTWSKRRQLIILGGLGFFVVTVLSISGYLYFYEAPSCSDNKQNQNETGVDCGGVCTRICAVDTKALTLEWVRLFKIRDGIYSAVARVSNPSVDSIARDVPYTFTLKDASGKEVSKRSGTVFVPARDTFVVFEGTITSSGNPESVSFQFDKEPEWVRSTYTQPKLAIIDKQLSDIEKSPRLIATVSNQSIVDVNNITLSSLIYDDQGNAVQVSQTYIEKIKAGATEKATFTWPQPISLKSRICESPVDTALVIDRSGSMEYLGTTPPQPLTDVKEAAKLFVSELSKFDQATVVSFANEASNPIDAFLSSNLSSIQDAILNISITPPAKTQNTNLGDGILKASEELESSRHRPKSGKIMVVLTDGVSTRPIKVGDTKYPESFALANATDAKAKGTRIFTIGLGKDLNQEFLKNVASAPGDFYLAPTATQLESIYHDIGTKMCERKPTSLEIIPSIPL